MTPLAEVQDTHGQLSAVDAAVRKGMEPPPHTHSREDEGFFIVAARWTFQFGDETIDAAPDAFVWAP